MKTQERILVSCTPRQIVEYSADHEEELDDLTCVAKLTDRWDRAPISARQLTPVKERRIIFYVSKTHTCVAKLTDRWDRAPISARQLTPVKERRIGEAAVSGFSRPECFSSSEIATRVF
jgi:hypothetical protein